MTATHGGRLTLMIAMALMIGGCGSAPPIAGEQTVTLPPDPTEVVFFYARPAEVVRGESVTMCFSSQGADTILIDPPIRELHPSISYCFNHEPQQTQTYTLTAQGETGKDSESITVRVLDAAEAPAEPDRMVVRTFTASSQAIRAGERTSICYILNGARSVEISPPPPGELDLERYCFATAPAETTTYTLTAADETGQEYVADLTVEVLD